MGRGPRAVDGPRGRRLFGRARRIATAYRPIPARAARDLQDLSALIGERDERTDSISVGDYGSRSLQRSMRRVPVMPPEVIRTLPFGTALVLLRSAPPVVTDLRPWTERKEAAQLSDERIRSSRLSTTIAGRFCRTPLAW